MHDPRPPRFDHWRVSGRAEPSNRLAHGAFKQTAHGVGVKNLFSPIGDAIISEGLSARIIMLPFSSPTPLISQRASIALNRIDHANVSHYVWAK